MECIIEFSFSEGRAKSVDVDLDLITHRNCLAAIRQGKWLPV